MKAFVSDLAARPGRVAWKLVAGVVFGFAFMATPALAETTTTCSEPQMFQPFSVFGDTSFYVPVPGESYDNLAGTGWTLSGGAKIVTATLYDGTQGSVLEVPLKATATSPPVCVNNLYPYLRTMVRSLGGAVKVTIQYAIPSGWGSTKLAGEAKSSTSVWQASSKLKVEVGPYSGWHLARFTLLGTGSKTTSDAQVYNFYVDPRMR